VLPRAKVFLQYTLIISATILLIWLSLRGLKVQDGENKWDYLVQTWHSADKGWLLLMACVYTISHLVRAERWRLVLLALGNKTTLNKSFLSLMVGYLVNLVIPRGGEVSRCYNMYKLDKIPVEVSFGTVVMERIVDLLCLVILIAISFILESQKLFAFIDTLPINIQAGSSKLVIVLWFGAFLLILVGILYWLIRKNKKLNSLAIKLWNGFKGGLLSVFKLESKGLFVFYSVVIWLLYFFMSYCVIMAFPATSELGFQAVLGLFAIGAIAMTVPLPGGTGSYHVLVPQGLVFLYGIPTTEAVAFTFIFHGWQTLIVIVAGALSLIVTSMLVKKNSQPL
jgi:glycosyltransferase 2 family protein